MNTSPVVVEQTLAAPVPVVWRAISDKDQMQKWFFETISEFIPQVGFETEFDVECDGKNYLHQWKVIEVIPEQKIAYQWKYGGFPGDSVVSWELLKEADGTKLTLVHSGQHTFALDNPAFNRESCQAGWDYFVKDSLNSFLKQACKDN